MLRTHTAHNYNLHIMFNVLYIMLNSPKWDGSQQPFGYRINHSIRATKLYTKINVTAVCLQCFFFQSAHRDWHRRKIVTEWQCQSNAHKTPSEYQNHADLYNNIMAWQQQQRKRKNDTKSVATTGKMCTQPNILNRGPHKAAIGKWRNENGFTCTIIILSACDAF